MSRSVCCTVSTFVDVDVDVELDQIDDETLIEELRKRSLIPSVGVADDPERLIENAYLDAIKMGNSLPQSIRDLLWKVHGRAIA